MKIGYVGNFEPTHSTENHLATTLEELGHEVIRIQENPINRANLVGQVRSCDLFLFTRTWSNCVTVRHLAAFRQLRIPTVSYHLDLYVGLQRQSGLAQDPFWMTDYVFTPDGDPNSEVLFKKQGIKHYYMKPGVFRDECYLAEPIEGAGNDVIFVGSGTSKGQNYHTEWSYRFELLKFLEDTYQSRYSKYGNPESVVRNSDLNELYASSKVVVGDSVCLGFDHTYYWSDRAYETLGRGGFLIHPYIKGMEEEFTDGQDIVFYNYNDWVGLKEKVDYYLTHEKERRAIMINGHNLVKRKCTYHNRMSQMLRTIGLS